MINLLKSLFKNKKAKNKKSSQIIVATPAQNNPNAPKFEIGNSSKLKSELKETKNNLRKIENKNKALSEKQKKYLNEKSNAGKKRHQKTEIIKNQIIKPMFENTELIKATSIKQRADKIERALINIFDEDNEKELQNFAQKYGLDFEILQNSKDYFLDEKSETIYRWCLKLSKK